MSETLLGVIIGGIIGTVAGSIVPIINMIIAHQRWKSEKKLEFLQAERQKKETLYNKILKDLYTIGEGKEVNHELIANISTDIHSYCPEEAGAIFTNFFNTERLSNNIGSWREDYYLNCYISIATILKKDIYNIDERIEEIVS